LTNHHHLHLTTHHASRQGRHSDGNVLNFIHTRDIFFFFKRAARYEQEADWHQAAIDYADIISVDKENVYAQFGRGKANLAQALTLDAKDAGNNKSYKYWNAAIDAFRICDELNSARKEKPLRQADILAMLGTAQLGMWQEKRHNANRTAGGKEKKDILSMFGRPKSTSSSFAALDSGSSDVSEAATDATASNESSTLPPSGQDQIRKKDSKKRDSIWSFKSVAEKLPSETGPSETEGTLDEEHSYRETDFGEKELWKEAMNSLSQALKLQPLHMQALWNRGVLQYLYPNSSAAELEQAMQDINEVYYATVEAEGDMLNQTAMGAAPEEATGEVKRLLQSIQARYAKVTGMPFEKEKTAANRASLDSDDNASSQNSSTSTTQNSTPTAE
jgi:hypothetical protein